VAEWPAIAAAGLDARRRYLVERGEFGTRTDGLLNAADQLVGSA
jgi:hypothetical protein